MKGNCNRGAGCYFAHSQKELREPPSLKKTKLCGLFMKGQCGLGERCSYAHGERELRNTDQFYKTAICRAFLNGDCSRGDSCRFAHGTEEIRTPTLTLPQKLEGESEERKAMQEDDDETHMIQEVLRAAQGDMKLMTPPRESSSLIKFVDF